MVEQPEELNVPPSLVDVETQTFEDQRVGGRGAELLSLPE